MIPVTAKEAKYFNKEGIAVEPVDELEESGFIDAVYKNELRPGALPAEKPLAAVFVQCEPPR